MLRILRTQILLITYVFSCEIFADFIFYTLTKSACTSMRPFSSLVDSYWLPTFMTTFGLVAALENFLFVEGGKFFWNPAKNFSSRSSKGSKKAKQGGVKGKYFFQSRFKSHVFVGQNFLIMGGKSPLRFTCWPSWKINTLCCHQSKHLPINLWLIKCMRQDFTI